jgi:hypothetical protein
VECEEEVVEVVLDCRRDVALEDPVQSFGEEVEDVRCRCKAEGESDLVPERGRPGEAKEGPVLTTNGDLLKGLLEVKLREESAWAKGTEGLDCTLKPLVHDVDLLPTDPVVHPIPVRPGEVVSATAFC